MTTTLWVVEVEQLGMNTLPSVRVLFGPFTDMPSARLFADNHPAGGRTMVRELIGTDPVKDSHIHPDQTNIIDHLTEIHDHVE